MVYDNVFMITLALVVVVFVLSQSLFFLIKAYQRGKSLGYEEKDMKRVIVSTMVFSLAPSVTILIALLSLSNVLGVVIPWIRLSVLGAVTYELPATYNVVEGIFKESIGVRISDPKIFVTVIWVMTLGVLPPMLIIPLFLKRIQNRVKHYQSKDRKWGDIFMNALFLGMISAFLGFVVAPVFDEVTEERYISLLAILTLLTSAGFMLVIGILISKFKQTWLKNYAISLSMIGAMIFSIIYALLGVR